jgi:hypothetical protein
MILVLQWLRLAMVPKVYPVRLLSNRYMVFDVFPVSPYFHPTSPASHLKCSGGSLLDLLGSLLNSLLGLLGDGGVLQTLLVHEDSSALSSSGKEEEEVDRGEAVTYCQQILTQIRKPARPESQSQLVLESGIGGRLATYKMLRGRMTKHHRVQMSPVDIRAAFCVSESFSAGRARSAIPAMTMAHCGCLSEYVQCSARGRSVISYLHHWGPVNESAQKLRCQAEWPETTSAWGHTRNEPSWDRPGC